MSFLNKIIGPGVISNLSISKSQIQLFDALKSSGVPIVTVLVEGRPRVIYHIQEQSDAVLMAYLPGSEGTLFNFYFNYKKIY
jgi:beta-glucosidase